MPALSPYVRECLTGVDESVQDLRARLAIAVEEGRAIAERVQEADARRTRAIAVIGSAESEGVGEAVAAAIGLHERAARIDHRIAALRDRIAASLQERLVLGILSDQLGLVADLDQAVIPDTVARHQRALRQMRGLVDAEFDRASDELQSGALQTLSNLVLEADIASRPGAEPTLAEIAGLRSGAEQSYHDLVGFAADRRHPLLDSEGLVAALRDLVATTAARGTVAIDLQVVAAERPLDRPTRSVLFRVVSESVANAVRHANAANVDVVLGYGAGRVAAVVRDDGEGFDVAATEARLGRTRGLGLVTMRQYAHAVGARIEIRSRVGVGSEVRLTV